MKCTVCGREFDRAQALGVHMAAHKRGRKPVVMLEDNRTVSLTEAILVLRAKRDAYSEVIADLEKLNES